MTFKDYWTKLNTKKKIDGDVRLSPAQFEKMLEQAYDIGYSAGCEKTKLLYDMLREYGAGNKDGSGDDAHSDLFGGSVPDFLKDIFSKKKT